MRGLGRRDAADLTFPFGEALFVLQFAAAKVSAIAINGAIPAALVNAR